MPTVLTRDEIIIQANRMSGSDSSSALTRDWLNNILDALARSYRWPELETTGSGSITIGVSSTALPADFGNLWNRLALTLTLSGVSHALEPLVRDEYNVIGDPTTQGTPKYVLFDLNAKTWVTFPLPDATYAWSLIYHIKPTRLASDVVATFANDEIIIQALYVRILQHDHHKDYIKEYEILLQLIAAYLRGTNLPPIQAGEVIPAKTA